MGLGLDGDTCLELLLLKCELPKVGFVGVVAPAAAAAVVVVVVFFTGLEGEDFSAGTAMPVLAT